MLKMSKLKKFISFSISIYLAFTLFAVNTFAASNVTSAAGSEETPFETYTYWDGLGSKEKTKVFTKPMYDVKTVLDSTTLKTELFGSVDDICNDGGLTYILDSKNSKIFVLNQDYNLQTKIEKIIYDGKELSIAGAMGIFVKNGQIYIADTKNARILVLGLDGNVIHYLTLPESKLIPSNFKYSPIKVAVDSRDYLYIASDGSYYGALVYSPDMEFLGFYGANTVAASVGDVIKGLINKVFTTDEKRAASIRSLPYQFTDFVVGPNDFIFTVTSTNDGDIPKGQVKRLNPGGKDVLKKDSYNFADDSTLLIKPESLKSIDVDSDGFFYVLDSSVYNRVFWYDKESNLICVFGGGTSSQVQKGMIALGGAVSINGTDILVSDPVSKNITVFKMTEYGKTVRDTQLATLNDDFENTIDDWNGVLRSDTNNQLAYRGLAKAYYTLGDYKKALEFSKSGADRETYADAFVKVRTAFLEKWFTLIFLGAVLLIAAIYLLVRLKAKRKVKLIKNEKVTVLLSSVFHPFESFRLVKEKNMGSVTVATVMLALFYILSAVSDTAMGYAFNRFDASSYNSFFVLLRTVALVLLFTVANWLVCVLMGGIGKLKEIYIVTCYSLLPTVVSIVVSIVFSHILAPEEFVFITILSTACIIYTLCILAVGIMKIHDYEFPKFLGTTVVTVIAMLIIVFLIFLIFMLAQQVYGWIGTIITEIKYR